MASIACPICEKPVKEININSHLDSGCDILIEQNGGTSQSTTSQPISGTQTPGKSVANFFARPTPGRSAVSASSSSSQVATKPVVTASQAAGSPSPVEHSHIQAQHETNHQSPRLSPSTATTNSSFINPLKRPLENGHDDQTSATSTNHDALAPPPAKRTKANHHLEKAAPLAERLRPKTLDDVCGQELVGPDGLLRGLIEQGRVPSMILWGSPGSGKTTIARLIASTTNTRFVEINSASTGVAECKKLFTQAASELGLTGRRTIIFCDEIHRFSKSQQDVLLAPVEAGIITLIGATTSNPSFSLTSALLSRCRVFVLSKLTEADLTQILERAVTPETQQQVNGDNETTQQRSPLLSHETLAYLAAFADGDARTALNLLELALDLCSRADMTLDKLKHSLTHTFVYDRAGDMHYDTISAFHKSIRGSDADAALYYLARMLQSGEEPRYIARRMVVIASEDVGVADNTLLPLAMAAYDAAEKIGMPEARIPLAHVTVALALAKKSTRAYRGLNNAYAALREPGIAGLPIPIHLRNAPTKLMKEMGYGKEYKYNPDYVDGRVAQEYLPEALRGRRFLEERDLGEEVDKEVDVEPDGFPVFYDE